ncbi:MAG: SAM-dependent chlorinase/fluorinase [Flavobacteriaceae bacterium]
MIITLTTDFGLQDHYVGALKGMIYTTLPQAKIVDISHLVDPFVTHQAAYIVRASYGYFPEKTIHILLVDAEISAENKPVLVIWNRHYFLSTDNGILSLLTQGETPEAILSLAFEEGVDSSLFFVKIASEIIGGKPVSELGQPVENLKEVQRLKAIVSEDNRRITGNIIYIDHYGNAISNIPKKLFEQIRNGRDFEILFRNYTIRKIYASYSSFTSDKNAATGEKIALFNNSELLEIALYKGNSKSGTAASLLGIEYQSSISVRFLDKP